MIRQGVTSFKAYTAYKGDLGVEDRDMYRLLSLMKETRCPSDGTLRKTAIS